MTYDHWKTTNPADEFSGPEPEKVSMYRPKPEDLKPVLGSNPECPSRWYIHDAYGEYDGPYASEAECWAVIAAERRRPK
jgi:hypothetical protein